MYKLEKSLYGLFVENKFKQTPADGCVYAKKTNDGKLIREVKRVLAEKVKTKDPSKPRHFLGINFNAAAFFLCVLLRTVRVDLSEEDISQIYRPVLWGNVSICSCLDRRKSISSASFPNASCCDKYKVKLNIYNWWKLHIQKNRFALDRAFMFYFIHHLLFFDISSRLPLA